MNDIPVSVYGVSSRTPKDLIASGYALTCEEYSATTAATYDVTVNYNELTTTIQVVVRDTVSKRQIKNYRVEGDTFTDGTWTAESGTVSDGRYHSDSAVAIANPFAGIDVVDGISIDLVVYGMNSVMWAPILGINKAGNNGFVTVTTNGTASELQMSVNDWNGNYVDHTGIATLSDQEVRITLTIASDGTMTVYVDGESVTLSGAATGSFANLVSDITADESAYTQLTFFGGGHSAWTGNFSGSIVSCGLYNYVLTADEISPAN